MALSTQRASASFLSNESTPRWKYDVFLSFRGVDTRKGFVSHLYHELWECQGITTFFDDQELEEGTSIPLELLSAIKESHIAIVVLSPNYASSKWCLDELTTILQCMEARNSVLPVFYETDPSNVGNQRGSFAKAFAEHEEKFTSTEEKKKVTQWREDLKKVSKISGWHSKESKCERELIEKIVQSVWRKGTRAIEGIVLQLPEIEEVVHWNCEAFSTMHGLRLLEFDNLIISSSPKFLPCSLRIMIWSWYPSKSLPPSFHPRFLTELRMPHSKLVRLWDGKENFPKLKYIDLIKSNKLIGTPDFTGIQNLEELVLEDCTKLVEIHLSIAVLKKLKVLNLRGCKSIKRLPSEVEMDSLEYLDLTECSKVKRIPEFLNQMRSLSKLLLGGTAIEKLPSSIGHLVGLTVLGIIKCRNLLDIPIEICNLKSLKRLLIGRSLKIEKPPGKCGIREPFVYMKNLRSHWFGGSIAKPRDDWGLLRLLGIRKSDEPCWGLVLSSLYHFRCLEDLQLRYCDLGEGDIPDDIGCLSSLRKLNLCGNNFVSLPASIKCLSQLESLCLEACERLEQLPDLPSNSKLLVNETLGIPAGLLYYQCRIRDSPWTRCTHWYPDIRPLVSEHLWVFFLPLEICHQEQFLFETCYCEPGMTEPKGGLNMVKKCGARLVYKKDLEELNRTLKILKRTHDYCEEAASSQSPTFEEHTRKRQKEDE
ncbi:unnamed protein product [Malus baccata var. baccata]